MADVAAQTRISRRYLEAIETDSTADLPGDFFYKAFIRQYAGALELDSELTDRILSSAVPIHEPDPVPVLSQTFERETGDSTRWRPSGGVAVVLLIAVIAGGSALYALWQRFQTPPEVATRQTPAEQVQKTPPTQTQVPPETPTAAATPAPEPVPAATPPSGGTGLELSSTEPAWVQVSSEGKTLFIGTVDPSEPRQFLTGETATLRTGNAGALEVRWNGRPVGSLGPKGHIRVVTLTAEGAEIAAPRPRVVEAQTATP